MRYEETLALAALVRLELSEEEARKIGEDIERVTEFAEALGLLCDDEDRLSGVGGREADALREDCAQDCEEKGLAELSEGARDGYVCVPRTVES